MQIKTATFCYCSNIHPGESWDEIFQNLKSATLRSKKNSRHLVSDLDYRIKREMNY